MDCPIDFDILCACALGELGAAEAEEVRRHLASCPRCARAAGAIERISGGLAGLPRLSPGARVWDGVREAVEERVSGADAPRAWLRLLFRPYALAGAAAVLVAGVALLRFAGGGGGRTGPGLAVHEMGGRFTRRPASGADAFLREARAVVADSLRCAEAGDLECWRGLKARVEGTRLRARGDRCAADDALSPAERALIGDSMRFVRMIGDWPASRLAAEGRTLAREIARENLPERLEKEGRR